jgi:phosphoribosylaminoimidazole-succinocarboxamide synthase
MNAITHTDIPGANKLFSGKVRDIYGLDEKHLLIVSTDRVSAFDHVFPNGIPGKGIILNKISNLWFSKMSFMKNHLVETDFSNFPKPFCDFPEILKDRSVIVRQCEKIDFECIARGYIIGSGWKDYQNSGAICGIELPKGLELAQELPEAIFTPSTKAETGHDENISVSLMEKELGKEKTAALSELTLKIYTTAREALKKCGIILADTKLEFGLIDGEITLIDEILTPDSSRFWNMSEYQIGTSPVSYDKQFIRDYLDTTDWDKNSAPPALPEDIIYKTKEKYEEILNKISHMMK